MLEPPLKFFYPIIALVDLDSVLKKYRRIASLCVSQPVLLLITLILCSLMYDLIALVILLLQTVVIEYLIMSCLPELSLHNKPNNSLFLFWVLP